MSTLLVQSCSNSKIETSDPTYAIELYTGYFFKIIKKAMRNDTENADIDIRILSAKYGIIEPKESIRTYDQRMNETRADELQQSVHNDLRQLILENDYDKVVINAGKEYRKALNGFDDELDVDTYEITGNGIGFKGRSLKQFLQGDESGLVRCN